LVKYNLTKTYASKSLLWMEDRETPWIHKYRETKKDLNYDGNGTLRHYRSETLRNFSPLGCCWTECITCMFDLS
jgi:hypothetical protein